jgi:hypothetical protein
MYLEEQRCIQGFGGKPEGTRPLGIFRRRLGDNIKMDHQEVGCGLMNWIKLAQNRYRWWTLVNSVMKFRVPQTS